jgi:hypothetical protein
MKRSRGTANLSESVHQRLSMYALAASAAGVGALALAQPAEARIVYTRANIKITQNGGSIFFDLNHDGIPDFGLSNKYFSTSQRSQGFVFLNAQQHQQANEIWQVGSQGRKCAGALTAGTKIGPSGNFQKDPKSGLAMAFENLEGTYYGPWLKVKQAYLGLKFVVKGKTHFGWAHIKLNPTSGLSISETLTGYAYETIPGKSIIAGKTTGRMDDFTNDDPGPAASLTKPIPDTPQPPSLGISSRDGTIGIS